jgi:hypothetical protein
VDKPLNPIIKAQLKEFNISNPGYCKDDSESFEVMSIFAIENGVLGENADPFKIHLKGNEFGIDGIAINIQGEICIDADEAESVLSTGKNHQTEFHFFQSKTSNNFDYGEISKFLDAVTDFFVDTKLLNGEQIEDLCAARDVVFQSASRSNPEVKCYFCNTGSGQISDPIKTLIDSNKRRLEELNIFSHVSINLLGAKDIQIAYRSATNAASATINFPKAVTMPEHEKVDQAYIGYISADQILEIASGEKDSEGNRQIIRSVFYDNVRDFNPDSEINQAIIRELTDGDQASFVFKNNGITIVAKEVSRKGDLFTLTDFQIVNGCQTTNILSTARDVSSKIMVPLRVIGCSDSEFVSSIIIGTNKQNEVRSDQFWALLPFMKDLETYCSAQDGDKKILIERRENQYRDIKTDRQRVMRTSDLMKVSAAMFFHQPHRAARDHRGIRNEFSDRIFLENHNVELYHAAALALYKFDYLVRNSRIERSKSIYKFYVLFTISRKFWKTADILSAPPKSQKKYLSSVLETILNTDELTTQITQVSNHIEKIISESSPKTREQIRDYIRTESFAEQFSKSYF